MAEDVIKKLGIEIARDLHQQVKTEGAASDKSLKAIVEEAFSTWLAMSRCDTDESAQIENILHPYRVALDVERKAIGKRRSLSA